MKRIILIVALALSACNHKEAALEVGVAPAAKMPALPDAMSRKAERLPDITDRSLGGLHRDGIEVDMRYNDLAYRHNALVDAWACVRQALNARTTSVLNDCFNGEKK